jgi:hypothetical protein
MYSCRGGCGRTVNARHRNDAWCKDCVVRLARDLPTRPPEEDINPDDIPF